MVGFSESDFEDLNRGSKISLFQDVTFNVRGDLIKDVMLKAVDSKSEFFLEGGEGSSFETELDYEGAEIVLVSSIFLWVWDVLTRGGGGSGVGDWGGIGVTTECAGDGSFSFKIFPKLAITSSWMSISLLRSPARL
jgi:hypothetical protein